MLQRAYSSLEIRAVDDEKWVIEGIASTPTPDRYGDVVEPMGAKFSIPMPLLWQHDSRKPVGQVSFAKPTAKGIPFRATINKASEFTSVVLKERALEAWESVKGGLVRAVSIGFTSIEHAFLKEGGIHFKEWEWLELSLVTIPANADASINSIKSFDAKYLAASGRNPGIERPTSPGASGKSVSYANTPKPERLKSMKRSIPEMVATLEATIEVKKNAQLDVAYKAAGEGRSKDASEQEAFDTLEDEIQSLEKEVGDWRKMERSVSTARPVETRSASDAGTQSRYTPSVRMEQKRAPGLRYAQVIRTLWMAHDKHRDVEVVARQLYPDDFLVQKAAVAAASTTGSTWGHELVGDETGVVAEFLEFLAPQTILGKFGTNGIPDVNRVPFRTPLITQTGGGDGYWVGEGQPKPLTTLDFARTTLEPLKIATIAVATKELLRSASPSADMILRNSLGNAIIRRQDFDFIDLTNDGTVGVQPASITYGAPQYVSSGDDADDVRLDVRSVSQGFINANNPMTSGVWLMSSGTALALSLLTNALGQPEFSGLTMRGGTFQGLPVIVSEHIGNFVVLVNANDIFVGDEGGVTIEVSTEASLQMMDNTVGGVGAPTNNTITPTATSLVSMFQTNSAAFLAERTINWKRARDSAVQVLTDVSWGGEVTEEES